MLSAEESATLLEIAATWTRPVALTVVPLSIAAAVVLAMTSTSMAPAAPTLMGLSGSTLKAPAAEASTPTITVVSRALTTTFCRPAGALTSPTTLICAFDPIVAWVVSTTISAEARPATPAKRPSAPSALIETMLSPEFA